MGLRIFQVDAFTDRPFAGNPAAVVLLDEQCPDEWMQAMAAEINLSETAFLLRKGNCFGLRWFTPTVEVKLCGHATLASAHVLWEDEIIKEGDAIRFDTKSGLLKASRNSGWIEMDFPSLPAEECSPPGWLSKAVGVEPMYVGRSSSDYLIEVETPDEVKGVIPDMEVLKTIPSRGFIVTSRSDVEGFDFISRFFAPAAGIPEDPVTGSAHCTLGPFWAERLGKGELTGFQASARGGVVRVRPGADRVYLLGQAVTVFSGELSC